MAEEGEKLIRLIGLADPDSFLQALGRESRTRAQDFLNGVACYRRHPYRRRPDELPVLWQQGATRLLDYRERGAAGPAVLVVPSLVNRAYILDLLPDASLMRHLARQGLRPFLLDWGEPGEEEKGFGLDDYVLKRLFGALDAVLEATSPPILVGYCMGGLLGLGLASARPADIAGLALLATPWDFGDFKGMASLLRPWLAPFLARSGLMPVDLLQTLFTLMDPAGVERRYRAFGLARQDDGEAVRFVALEDWLNDGVPLAGKVASECLFGWYGENDPAEGRWCLGGRAVLPRDYPGPSLSVIPARDRIVPPQSARALAQAMQAGREMTVAAGHVGMVCGRNAEEALFAPLAAWVREIGSG